MFRYTYIACFVTINLVLTTWPKWVINKYQEIRGGASTSFYRQRKASNSLVTAVDNLSVFADACSEPFVFKSLRLVL